MKTNILDVPKASEINEHQDQWAGAGNSFFKTCISMNHTEWKQKHQICIWKIRRNMNRNEE
jgi:hypothetical protein